MKTTNQTQFWRKNSTSAFNLSSSYSSSLSTLRTHAQRLTKNLTVIHSKPSSVNRTGNSRTQAREKSQTWFLNVRNGRSFLSVIGPRNILDLHKQCHEKMTLSKHLSAKHIKQTWQWNVAHNLVPKQFLDPQKIPSTFWFEHRICPDMTINIKHF